MNFFTHFASYVMKSWQQICYMGFYSCWPFYYGENVSLPPQMKTTLPFPYHLCFWQSWTHRSARIWCPSNTYVLIFSNDTAGRTKTVCWKHSPSVFNAMAIFSSGPTWCVEEEISFLDWRLDHWQSLAYQLPEYLVITTLSNSIACLLIGGPTSK